MGPLYIPFPLPLFFTRGETNITPLPFLGYRLSIYVWAIEQITLR